MGVRKGERVGETEGTLERKGGMEREREEENEGGEGAEMRRTRQRPRRERGACGGLGGSRGSLRGHLGCSAPAGLSQPQSMASCHSDGPRTGLVLECKWL